MNNKLIKNKQKIRFSPDLDSDQNDTDHNTGNISVFLFFWESFSQSVSQLRNFGIA